jgi:hypothetical protein
VINGGPKCIGVDLDALMQESGRTSESQEALKHQLELLRETWALFENAVGDAKDWEQRQRKREDDDEDIDRLSQSSQRTTRSQSRSAHSSTKSKPSTPRNDENTTGGQGRPGTNVELKQTSHPRKRAPSSSETTLTEGAVLRLGKRQKTANLNAMVRRWVESVCG